MPERIGLPLICLASALAGASAVVTEGNGLMRREEDISHSAHPAKLQCSSTKGPFTIELDARTSPRGVERVLGMARDGFFTDLGMFRCVDGFIAQFGISGDAERNDKWQTEILDDEKDAPSKFPKGTLSFAGNGPNSRNTQLFITLADLTGSLGDNAWETPVGRVVEGLDVLDKLHTGYGEGPPNGNGPDQQKLFRYGNAYLQKNYPELDYIQSCSVVGEASLGQVSESAAPIPVKPQKAATTVKATPAADADEPDDVVMKSAEGADLENTDGGAYEDPEDAKEIDEAARKAFHKSVYHPGEPDED